MNNYRKLIINADDFGWSEDINAACIALATAGNLTSVSFMANSCTNSHKELSKLKNLDISIGVHLNISTGQPINPSTINSPLVTHDGFFKANNKNTNEALLNALRIGSIQKEFDAQIEYARGLGIEISHLDTHHHVAKIPTIAFSMANSARKHNIRCVRAPASFNLKRFDLLRKSIVRVNKIIFSRFNLLSPKLRFGLTKQNSWSEFVNTIHEWTKSSVWQPGSTAELNCHPSFCNGVSGQSQEMAVRRPSDLKILSNEKLSELFASLKIRLITYHDL